jgi:hypothetical protein
MGVAQRVPPWHAIDDEYNRSPRAAKGGQARGYFMYRMGLDRDEHHILRTGIQGSRAYPRSRSQRCSCCLEDQATLAYGCGVRAARDHRDVVAGIGKAYGNISPNGARTDDAYLAHDISSQWMDGVAIRTAMLFL